MPNNTINARRLVASVLTLVVATGFIASCSDSVESPRVLLVGDSILNQSADAVRASLEQQEWSPVVAAFGGTAIEQWTARLPALIAEHDPSIVVVELGTNDCTAGPDCPIDQQVEAALDALGRRAGLVAQRADRSGLPGGCRAHQCRAEAATASHPNLEIVDFSDEFAGHPGWLDAGGPHLTPVGQLEFAKLITDAVDEFHVADS